MALIVIGDDQFIVGDWVGSLTAAERSTVSDLCECVHESGTTQNGYLQFSRETFPLREIKVFTTKLLWMGSIKNSAFCLAE